MKIKERNDVPVGGVHIKPCEEEKEESLEERLERWERDDPTKQSDIDFIQSKLVKENVQDGLGMDQKTLKRTAEVMLRRGIS